MKTIYLILMVSSLIFGALIVTGVLPFFNLTTILCSVIMIPQIVDPEFDFLEHARVIFESCGR